MKVRLKSEKEYEDPLEVVYGIIEKSPLDLFLFYYLGSINEKLRENPSRLLYLEEYIQRLGKRKMKKALCRLSKVHIRSKKISLLQKRAIFNLTNQKQFPTISVSNKILPLSEEGKRIWKHLDHKKIWEDFKNYSVKEIFNFEVFETKIEENFLRYREKLVLKNLFGIRKTFHKDKLGNSVKVSLKAKNFYAYPIQVKGLFFSLKCIHCNNHKTFYLSPEMFKKSHFRFQFKYVCEKCSRTVFYLKLPENRFYIETEKKAKSSTYNHNGISAQNRKRRKILNSKKIRKKRGPLKKKIGRIVKTVSLNGVLFIGVYGLISLLSIYLFELFYGESFDFLLEFYLGIEVLFFLVSFTISGICFLLVKILIYLVIFKYN